MPCSPKALIALMAAMACVPAAAQMPTYGVGRAPTKQEVAAWDIAIGPQGKELPPGSGTTKEGQKIYAEKCASCHEPNATGVQFGPRLAGGKGTTGRTVGNFWPFATTIWDYINRTMPWGQGGTLGADEVYALTAFVLYRNDIIKESDVIDANTLPKVQMPNRDGFIPPHPTWRPPK